MSAADLNAGSQLAPPGDAAPLMPRRRRWDIDAELDITPMIDVTFLLLIFFLVASVPDPSTAVSLPEARHGTSVGTTSSTILTVCEGGLGVAAVYAADGRVESAQLSENPEVQADQIQQAVYRGLQEGRPNVLIKAEAGVAHREVARVAAAASRVEGIRLHVAVLEVE